MRSLLSSELSSNPPLAASRRWEINGTRICEAPWLFLSEVPPEPWYFKQEKKKSKTEKKKQEVQPAAAFGSVDVAGEAAAGLEPWQSRSALMKNGESQREAGRRRRDGGVERGREYKSERERERGEGSDVYLQGGFLKAPMLHQPAHSIDSTGFFAFFACLVVVVLFCNLAAVSFKSEGAQLSLCLLKRSSRLCFFFLKKNLLQHGVWHQSEKSS